MIINKFIIYTDEIDCYNKLNTIDINEKLYELNESGYEVVTIDHSTKDVHIGALIYTLNTYKVLYKKDKEL